MSPQSRRLPQPHPARLAASILFCRASARTLPARSITTARAHPSAPLPGTLTEPAVAIRMSPRRILQAATIFSHSTQHQTDHLLCARNWTEINCLAPRAISISDAVHVQSGPGWNEVTAVRRGDRAVGSGAGQRHGRARSRKTSLFIGADHGLPSVHMTEAPGSTGANLRLARQARGFSQQQLASMAGVSRQAVSAVESGHSDPSLRVALAL